MKAIKLTPLLRTNQFLQTIKFYTETLGFDCANRSDDLGWAALRFGEVEVMLASPNEHMPFEKPSFTGSLYLQIEGVDELYQQLKGSVEFAYPLEDFEWGMREFAIYDNNGYVLQFGEEIQQ